ncbi:MAG: helix-turn-helix domain-containing GNAT family N-acetyltransferase [Pseudomonadota bacterium]
MDAIDRIRAFNRHYTQAMGLVTRNYLDSGFTATEVRVLYELSVCPDATARQLADDLGLDEGHLSRVLKRFERDGLLVRRPSTRDARQRHLTLTAPGRRRMAGLVQASRDFIAARCADLGPCGTDGLADALDIVTRHMTPIAPDQVQLRDIAIGDAGWLIQRHGEDYVVSDGFDATFETLVADILVDFLRTHDPATERAFIAEARGRRLGSIFCVRSGTPGVAKLRLFYLVPEARGLGLGRRMLESCLGFARDASYTRMTLWTHESHRAACRLYERYGFTLTGSKPTRSFGVDVVEQQYELTL